MAPWNQKENTRFHSLEDTHNDLMMGNSKVYTFIKPDINPSLTPCFSRKASLYSERSFIRLVLIQRS